MLEKFDNVNFAEYHQTLFLRAIRDDDVERAYHLINSLPKAKNQEEGLQRTLFLDKAYKLLIETYRKLIPQIIADYSSLGTCHQIKTEKHILEQYRKLGSLEEVESKLASLKGFFEGSDQIATFKNQIPTIKE